MAHDRKFRFAAQVASARSASEWAESARRAEDMGYSVLTMPDHFDEQLAPVPALMAAADATTTLRVGTLVFCNDYRHPLMLAKEAATLDLLSDGRLELSLGAGWMRQDYEEAGMTYDPPGRRVDRFEEAISVMKGLMGDEAFTFEGDHFRVSAHNGSPKPRQRPHPPLMIGGGGKRVLSIAAREADIVGINADLREGLGGAETAPNMTPEATGAKVDWVKEAAGARFDELELNVLIGFAMVTDDPRPLAEGMAGHFGISAEESAHVPVCLFGTVEEMVEELRWRRERWGFSYVAFDGASWEAMAPVVEELAGT
jgi:probable F420-dependent oxidoreductase